MLDAMAASDTMTGRDGHRVLGLPHDRVRELMRDRLKVR